jgi:hypothetical protein
MMRFITGAVVLLGTPICTMAVMTFAAWAVG